MNQWVFYVVGGIIGIPCLHVSAPQLQIPSGMWSNAEQDKQLGVPRAARASSGGMWAALGVGGELAVTLGQVRAAVLAVLSGQVPPHTCATDSGLPWACTAWGRLPSPSADAAVAGFH